MLQDERNDFMEVLETINFLPIVYENYQRNF